MYLSTNEKSAKFFGCGAGIGGMVTVDDGLLSSFFFCELEGDFDSFLSSTSLFVSRFSFPGESFTTAGSSSLATRFDGSGNPDFFLIMLNSSSSVICLIPKSAAFANFAGPDSSPINMCVTFLDKATVTVPPHDLIKSAASSRSIDSKTPVITNRKSLRQFGFPFGISLQPWLRTDARFWNL